MLPTLPVPRFNENLFMSRCLRVCSYGEIKGYKSKICCTICTIGESKEAPFCQFSGIYIQGLLLLEMKQRKWVDINFVCSISIFPAQISHFSVSHGIQLSPVFFLFTYIAGYVPFTFLLELQYIKPSFY